jgi:hypothetical protein
LHGWTSTKRLSKIALYEWLDGVWLKKVDAVVRVCSGSSSGKRTQPGISAKRLVVENGIPSLRFDKQALIRKDSEIGDFCGSLLSDH